MMTASGPPPAPIAALAPAEAGRLRPRDRDPVRERRAADARHVVVRYTAVRFAEQRHLEAGADDVLHLVHGGGRGARLGVPAGNLSLLMPLAGCLQLESSGLVRELPAGRLQAWRDTSLRVDCPSSGLWLVLTGSLRAWSRLGRGSGLGADHCVFPRQDQCPRSVRRLLVRLARRARSAHALARDPGAIAQAAYVALVEHQADLHARLDRCSGRTAQRRQQTMMRLLRVRHLIETSTDDRPDLAQLARSANYSPWHLIRLHREVFGETPSEYASRLRLDRAWTLVRDTRMPICEITGMLGFESQSSFCRAFKNTYGTTTGQVRQNAGPGMRACNEAAGSPPGARAA